MDPFAQKVAIITGGASGIGRALGQELARRNASVVLADIDGEAAEATAGEIGVLARAATVDVTDAGAVARLVEETAAAHGHLDYMFNNAGIAVMGETRDMPLSDWNRLIDINLRGVVHGIAAAYPIMLRQRFGHIVNTASAAGILPAPGVTGYAATKFAVVGLSTSLRGEAADLGVKVSVVCPGVIDTPLKYRTKLLNTDSETVLASLPFGLYPAERCARDILRGVARNKAIIVVTRSAKAAWLLYRFAPGLVLRIAQLGAARSPILDRGSPGSRAQ